MVCFYVSACRLSDFECENGECIPRDRMCDGYYDCADGSDEQYSGPGAVCREYYRVIISNLFWYNDV